MSDKIFLLKDDGDLLEMVETRYDSEDLLQQLLEDYPALLAGDQIDPTEPKRWLLITREMGIPDSESSASRWALDHLFIDQEGVPTLVEVKRSTDSRIRREVVAQMLDYAANSVQYWSIEDIITSFTRTCAENGSDPDETLAAFLPTSIAPDDYWDVVLANLRQGKIRLLFIADAIPPELKRIIEFLNEQMSLAVVLGVEVKQYTGPKMKVLVPRVVGQTMRAVDIKSIRSGKPRQWDRESFLEQVKEKAGGESAYIVDKVLEWANSNDLWVQYGRGARLGTANIGCNTPDGRSCRFIALGGLGEVTPCFDNLINFPPFERREMRERLLGRLNKESCFSFDPGKIDTWSSRPLTALTDENCFHAFCEIMGWVRDELTGHPPTL